MGSETGFILRFPGNLDPRAEEFRPSNTNPIHLQPAATVFPQPTTCFPYPCPYTSAVPVPIAVGVPYPTPAAAFVTPQPPPPHLSTLPTRSLLLSPLPSEPVIISESSLRRELEVFGDVRGVQMEWLCNGNVTVHFYDIRHAETALTAIQGQHMSHQARIRNYYASLFMTRNPSPYPPPLPPPARGLIAGRAVWAQYVFPACNAIPDGQNQGTIVIFNLDSDVSAENVRELFEAFGPVKELRDTPYKRNQRFVEFYDIRDAAKALKHMNGKEINGKTVFIEFSRGGGYGRKSFHYAASSNNNKANFNLNNNVHVPPHLQRRRFVTDQPQLCVNNKSTSFNYKGSPKKIVTNCGGSSIEEAIGLMNLSGEVGNGVEEQHQQHSQGSSRRKHTSCESTIESAKQQQQQLHSSSGSSSKHWKGKQGKKHETRFLIKEDAIVESGSRDSRTTVMIKNIPNKYSQKLLLNMLDNHCIHCNEQIGDGDEQPLSSYDFVYLPIDFNNKCNVGYGFVNMTSPEATLRLYKAFHLQHWEVFNSRKICEVTYARVQGLEALKEHFKNSKFPCETEHYMPVVFCPSRDGRELTEPLPIVGNKHQTIPTPIGVNNSDENEIHGGDNNRVGASASASDDVLSSQSGGVSVEEGDTSELTYDDTDREV